MTTAEALQHIQDISSHDADSGDIAPVQQIEYLVQAGLLQIVLPGRKLDFNKKNTSSLLQLLKSIGRADLSVGRIYEGHINALFLIHLFATDHQKETWFADAANGFLFGVWNTQANDGVEIEQKDNCTFSLTGKKTFASGSGIVQRALVTGNINSHEKKGWQMCIVNTEQLSNNNIDYNSWKPPGMKSSISYTFNFLGYEGKSGELLGDANKYYRQPYFSAGAMRFCAVQLGGAESLLNDTIAYLKSLNRTDDALQNARIAEMIIAVTSGDLWLQQAAANWDKWTTNESENSRLIAFANMTRTTIEKICLQVIELSSKCIGARGLLPPYTMEKRVRDLQFYLRQPAPDAALLDVAKYIIQADKNIETVWNDND